MIENRNKKISTSKGFTIIEVMIVLAIAGLIMLIVFLAVPALQRNARNTQVKEAVGSLLGGVNEYETNNSGGLPTGISGPDATGNVTFSGGTSSTARIQSGLLVTSNAAAPASPPAFPTTTGTIAIALGFKCNGTAFAATATPRAVAAGYNIENSATTVAPQCQDS